MFPRIYLAIDNCFASKRWAAPLEWMQIARDCDIHYIEASADNECDPLYTPPDALAAWREAVLSATQDTGVKVANLYSGHGTYATLGLAHPDKRVRDHIQHRWLEPMIDLARSLEAGLGFFCHAFSQATLVDPVQYESAVTDLTRRLGELAAYAQGVGLSSLSVEQMYTPHQIPWTIDGAEQIMHGAYRQTGAPLYITLDTGHQVGQQHFQKPSAFAFRPRPLSHRRLPHLRRTARLGRGEKPSPIPTCLHSRKMAICMRGCGGWVVIRPSSTCSRPMAASPSISHSQWRTTGRGLLSRSGYCRHCMKPIPVRQ